MDMASATQWLPIVFMVLMGIAILAYVVLDGYDLGVGMLMSRADEGQKDTMIASIGPFWDANETWLVLGIGLLLVAFPQAHGIILTALYLPVAIMLAGLIMRGVAFDFRAKAMDQHKQTWDRIFIGGSFLTALSQGFMLGMYIVGFEYGMWELAFAALCGLCLAAGYCFIGAGWLIMKTEDALQIKSIKWARRFLRFTALGLALVSIATPLVSQRIFDKWFSLPNFFLLLPIPAVTLALLVMLELLLRKLPRPGDAWNWAPFTGAIGLFILGFHGLGYSFYPYIVQDRLTIWESASSPEALLLILVGALVVLPCIAVYTAYSYYVFRGKARDLRYD